MTASWRPNELVCTIGEDPTGGRIRCELIVRDRQRTSWRVTITGYQQSFPGVVLYDATGETHARRGYRLRDQARDVVARLLPFVLADAECYRSTMGARPPIDGWIFNEQVAEWAYLNDNELACLEFELVEPPASPSS